MNFLSKINNLFYKFFFILNNINCKINTNIKIYNQGILFLGKKISIEKGCTFIIKKNSKLEIRDNVFIGKDVEISVEKNIFLGENTSIQSRANIFGDVKILSNCIIGPNFYASSFSHEYLKKPEELISIQDTFSTKSKPILINEDCFIGINVFIKPGLIIGRGCVVGANTNVLNNLKPYSVVSGNPAKNIKQRLDFKPKNKIFSNNMRDLPYFYRGFKKNLDNQLNVIEKNFVLVLDINNKKTISIEILSNFSSSLTFVNTNIKKTFSKGDIILTFEVDTVDKNFLEFQIDHSLKNKTFQIKKVQTN
jgi:acetyltransferase-like isoleucine patch superfamily enzyme